ncbi:MAG: 50S ribosomal protein L11 methyltransferase [Verrucomicrobiales bacterium]
MWVWSKLSARKWLDAWEERFYGNANAVITELKGGKSLRVEVYCETEAEAEEVARQFGGRVRELKREDWAEQKVPVGPPLKIRDAFLITQEGDDGKLAELRAAHPKRQVISIPAEMAFGTGDHATTSTVLRMLVDDGRKREAGWRFLDLGTGSGVLAVAARHLGAGGMVALDYDPMAVTVARRNLERNGVRAEKGREVEVGEADVTSWAGDGRFAVVAANLFSDVLIATLPRLRPWLEEGAVVFLSGILATQWELVRAAAEKEGFAVVKKIQKGKWVSARLE